MDRIAIIKDNNLVIVNEEAREVDLSDFPYAALHWYKERGYTESETGEITELKTLKGYGKYIEAWENAVSGIDETLVWDTKEAALLSEYNSNYLLRALVNYLADQKGKKFRQLLFELEDYFDL